MARPIKPTPPLNQLDFEVLVASLETGCSPEVMARRIRAAKKWLAENTLPKGATRR